MHDPFGHEAGAVFVFCKNEAYAYSMKSIHNGQDLTTWNAKCISAPGFKTDAPQPGQLPALAEFLPPLVRSFIIWSPVSALNIRLESAAL